MFKKVSFFLMVLAMVSGCELTNELNDSSPVSITPVGDLLNGAYSSMRSNYQAQDQLLALAEHTADGLAGPTRGGDWDDAGLWRSFHLHTWTPTLGIITNQWNTMSGSSFAAQNVICAEGASAQEIAEGTFVRAFNDYLSLDNFGIFQRRECGTSLLDLPVQIKRDVGADQLIAEVEAVLNDLPETADPGRATRNAARALLMKLYLNKAVYAATTISGSGSVAANEGPYTFAAADMNQVITYADAIIGSGLSLPDDYWDNFVLMNSETSTELIFVFDNSRDGAAGALRSRWFMGTHYNQRPSGWNGFVALTDLYNLYESDDDRLDGGRRAPLATYNVGFIVGQQTTFQEEGETLEELAARTVTDGDGNPVENADGTYDLVDRLGNRLVFTPEFSIQETGSSLEVSGIRTAKYVPNLPDIGDPVENDFVVFRLADVILMKAEAILRGGTSAETPLGLVNQIRERSNASELGSVTLDDVLDERHRELWHECWRRNDLIRYNRFLGTWQEKPASTSERLLFPIPADALGVNPSLVQNAGY